MAKTYLTAEGMAKIKNELQYLINVEKRYALEAIDDAKSKGDVSESEEYNIAKENYENLNDKINKLNDILINSITINENNISTDIIGLLNKVSIRNLKNNKITEYTLVPGLESNLKENKLSSSSPIGCTLMNKCVGDVIIVNTPKGEVNYEILTIGK